jgi:hypothetical protein
MAFVTSNVTAMTLLLQGHQLMAAVAADNCWLMANSSLPQSWPAAAADAALQARFSTAAAHITRQAMQQAMAARDTSRSSSSAEVQQGSEDADSESHVQLLVVGGLGLQAMQLAAAASNVQDQLLRSSQQQQGAAVPSMALSFVPTDSLTAQLASQLFADNDLDDIIDVCSWTELRQQQQQYNISSSSEAAAGDAVSCAALLAGVVQPNWSNAVAACLSACRGLTALTSSSRDQACVLSPACIRVWAVPVSCKDLLNLNEVDLQEIAQQTAGSYNYAAANAALRRSSRPCQVSRFKPQLLADPVVVLELKPQQLLQNLQQQGQASKKQQLTQPQQTAGSGSGNADTASPSGSDASAALAAALCSAGSAAASTAVQIHTSGRLDCVVWWLEFELAPGCSVSYAPAAAAAVPTGRAGGTSSSSSRGKGGQLDVLRPHAWQHVQYLPPQQQQQQQAGDNGALAAVCYQGQEVSAGQQLLLQVQASVDQLSSSLFSSSSSSSDAAAVDGLHSLQQQVAQLSMQQQQQEGAGQILPYHLSMLNDYARTRAYDQGISAAVQELLQQQQQQGEATVVLDVGCGTGLLSMMVATAAAAGDGDGISAKRLQAVGE